MSSFVAPVRQLSHSLIKRVRSASPSSLSRSPVTDKENCCAMKVTKRQLNSSPRSAAQQQLAAVSIMTSSQRPSLTAFASSEKQKKIRSSSRTPVPAWPVVKSCDGVRNAITFLQTSRQHAMVLMLQNHWERAVGVLEKIEKATESVCSQRRKVVIQQANAQLNGGLAAQIDDLGLSDDGEAPVAAAAAAVVVVVRRQRSVRFSEQVSVAIADDMDRSSYEVPSPVREEMLVLRASRSIPKENFSEFW